MKRYQNIQRTITTERPEEDSDSQNCEQIPAGGGGGGGGSDSEAESSQSSLGMRGGFPGFLECFWWQCNTVCNSSQNCTSAQGKEYNGTGRDQGAGERDFTPIGGSNSLEKQTMTEDNQADKFQEFKLNPLEWN